MLCWPEGKSPAVSGAPFARAAHSQPEQPGLLLGPAPEVENAAEVVDGPADVALSAGQTERAGAVRRQQRGGRPARVVVDDPGPGAGGQLRQQVVPGVWGQEASRQVR